MNKIIWPRKLLATSFVIFSRCFFLIFLSVQIFSQISFCSGEDDNKTVRISAKDLLEEWAAVTPVDYFDKDKIPLVKQIVFNRERYHLGKSFSDSYAAQAYSAAIADLRFVLKSVPNHPQALFHLTSISKLTHNPTLPTVFFERAVKLYPNHAITWAQYGSYLAGIGRMDSGIRVLKHALELDPKHALAYAWLAEIYYAIGDVESAKASEIKARQLGFIEEINKPKPK